MAPWLWIILLVALLAASAFFSAAETAVFSLQREAVAVMREEKNRRANLVAALLERPRDLLATILLGNLAVNTLFYALTAVAAYRLAQIDQHAAAAAAGVAGLFVMIVVGEILPKALAFSFNRAVAVAVSVPLYGIYTVLGPVGHAVGAVSRVLTAAAVRLAQPPRRITREELSMLVDAARAQGHIAPQAGEMIEGVMVLGETRVREVMTPRVDIIACPRESTVEDLVELFRRTRRTNIPVYEGNIDNVVGIANVKDALVEPAQSLAAVTGTVTFVPEAKTAASLLHEFQKEGLHLAVVVDEYGGTSGIVTLADLVEEIVGPLGDEYEPPEESVAEVSPGCYRLAGDLSIKDWNELFGMNVENERLSTLGGFIALLLGRVPRAGDTVTYRNVRFTVEEARRHRIVSVRAELLEEGAGPAREARR